MYVYECVHVCVCAVHVCCVCVCALLGGEQTETLGVVLQVPCIESPLSWRLLICLDLVSKPWDWSFSNSSSTEMTDFMLLYMGSSN